MIVLMDVARAGGRDPSSGVDQGRVSSDIGDATGACASFAESGSEIGRLAGAALASQQG
jgi:hypothetical protein